MNMMKKKDVLELFRNEIKRKQDEIINEEENEDEQQKWMSWNNVKQRFQNEIL